jgi:hypothetical protein
MLVKHWSSLTPSRRRAAASAHGRRLCPCAAAAAPAGGHPALPPLPEAGGDTEVPLRPVFDQYFDRRLSI